MYNQKVFIIAEAGVNHNGDEATALRLVEEAAKAGADAVKFQTFKADSLVTKSAETAEYQQKQTGNTSQHKMLQKLELSEQTHENIFAHCTKHNIEFMSTAFDNDSLDFLCELGIQRIKIPSGELTNTPLLSYSASKNFPIIVSTGMATMQEVEDVVRIVKKNTDAPLTLLHCTSNYPTDLHDVHLNAMKTMADAFKIPVGYSDHTTSTILPAASVAMGATVIEKHLTLDIDLEGPDHRSSLTPELFQNMVQGIREVEQCLGSTEKKPTESELKVRDVVRRSVVSACKLDIGTIIAKEDVVLKRPGTGIPPSELHKVIGKKVTRSINPGTVFVWGDLSDA